MNNHLDSPPVEVTQDFLRTMIRKTDKGCLERTQDGFYIFLAGNSTVTDDIKTWAREKLSILINPTRRDTELYMPRQTYFCDHQFDSLDPEDGCIVIENQSLFWRNHEREYQAWYKATRPAVAGKEKAV